jgi:putative flippase GtrA
MEEILKMLGLVILQNASFTLVSRARNSKSLGYHAIASILSNGIWLLVIRQVVTNFDKPILMLTYLVGSVIGSVGMHYLAMKYFEKNDR